MIEALKSVGRQAMRQVYASPIRGKTRMRTLLDGVLAPLSGVEELRIGDYTVELDHRALATRNMAYLSYEVYELMWLRRLLQPGDVVLDVGANVGYMAAQFARIVGPGGRVFAFEPSARAFAILSRVANSGRSWVVRAVRAAVSNRCGTAVYFETDQILSAGYGRIDHRPSEKFRCDEQRVALTTLDAFASEHTLDEVRFVKLDVEGAERAAIEGMTRLLTHSPMVLTEISTTTEEARRDLHAYGDLLRSFGLRAYSVGIRLTPVDHRRIPDGKHINVLWLPEDVGL
jgi:methyltransferase, FkbM family